MALDYTPINAVTQDTIIPYLQNNWFLEGGIVERLKTKCGKTRSIGTLITQPFSYAGKTAVGEYDGFSIIDTTPNDSISGVTYTWGHVYVSLPIAWTDELKNADKEQIIDFVSEEVETCKETIADRVTKHLFATSTSTYPNGCVGLPIMCHTTTEFGGISSSDTSVWAASVDSSTTVLSIPGLIGQYGNQKNGKNVPTVVVSNQDCWDKYFSLLEIKTDFRVQKQNNELGFNGMDWIVDGQCNGSGSGTADNYLYMLCEPKIQLYINPKDNMKSHGWTPLQNQIGKATKITMSLQLGTSYRRGHGVQTTLNPAL